MSAFSEASLVEKLVKLNDTQDSIGLVSHWTTFHRKHAQQIADVWAREIKKVSAHKKLTLLYLCNDVAQNARKKGDEFTIAYAAVLPEVLTHVAHHAPTEVLGKISRLINIWEERNVFPAPVIAQLRSALPANLAGNSGGGSSRPPPSSASSPASTAVARSPHPPQPHASSSSAPPAPAMLSTLLKQATHLEKLEAELETAPAAGGGHFPSLKQQIQAIPEIYFEDDALREYRGKPEAITAAAELQTAIIALTNRRNMLQASVDARMAILQELQRLMAVQEGLLKKNGDSLGDATNKLSRATRTHQSLVRSAEPSAVSAYSSIPRTPPGEPPRSASSNNTAMPIPNMALDDILSSLGNPTTQPQASAGMDAFVDFSAFEAGGAMEGDMDAFASFIATPPSDGGEANGDETEFDLGTVGLGSGGVGARR